MAQTVCLMPSTPVCSGPQSEAWAVCMCMPKWPVCMRAAWAGSRPRHHHPALFFFRRAPGALPPYFKVRSGTLMPRWRGGEANGFGLRELQGVSCFWTTCPDGPRPPTLAPCCAGLKAPRHAGSGPDAASKGGPHATAALGLGPLPGPGQWAGVGQEPWGCPYLNGALSASLAMLSIELGAPESGFFWAAAILHGPRT